MYALLWEQREADLDFMLLQNGIPCGGKDYLSILQAWREGEEECGAFDTGQDIVRLLESFAVKKRNNELQLTGEVLFENRSADLTFTFEPDGTITALTVGGHYDMDEIMKKAMQNTAISMGVVFAVLVFMSVIISCLRFAGALQNRKGEEGTGSNASGTKSRAARRAAAEEDIAKTLGNLLHQTAFGFEPLLLVPIAFGMLLVNIYPDIMAQAKDSSNGIAGLLRYFYLLDEWSILPSLIFMG